MATTTRKTKKKAAKKTASRPAKKAAAKKAPAKPAKKASAKKAAARRTKAGAKKATKKVQARAPAKPAKKKLSQAPAEIQIDADTLEFIAALDDYKLEHNRPFPGWSEVLYVLKGLGYRKG